LNSAYLKATNTFAEYVLFIAFPLQQWFNKRASVLRYGALPVLFVFVNGIPQQTDEFANEVGVYSVNRCEKQMNASVQEASVQTILLHQQCHYDSFVNA
jgi:hypothetical protein